MKTTILEMKPNQYGHYTRLTLERVEWWDGVHWTLEQLVGNVGTGAEKSLGAISLTDGERALLAARLAAPDGETPRVEDAS